MIESLKKNSTIQYPAVLFYNYYLYSFQWKYHFYRQATRVYEYQNLINLTYPPHTILEKLHTYTQISNSGWHCSNCLPLDAFLEKLGQFSHFEDYPIDELQQDKEGVRVKMMSGVDVIERDRKPPQLNNDPFGILLFFIVSQFIYYYYGIILAALLT
eukprot:TRINITY_DN5180_c0_g2_i2.p1 TRINITY_DN5180_c0_g2~~TRINITY_DN5180_c0_g2_i2.p1  ORF type:complete len:157 (+),score=41.01 TRINITY_DN5180_c0_g2_i2:284-754(+)